MPLRQFPPPESSLGMMFQTRPAGSVLFFSHVSVAASATENLPKREGALLESENNETFLLRAGDLQERPINPAPLPPGRSGAPESRTAQVPLDGVWTKSEDWNPRLQRSF